jgi:predicted SprT family Zn-dependent metalloprotease
MNTKKLQKIAKQDIKTCKLVGWRFRWSTTKKGLGYCNFRTKTLVLSRPLAKVNCESRMQYTWRHEIAHALAGANAGHGTEWKRVVKACGGGVHEYADPKVDKLPLVTLD